MPDYPHIQQYYEDKQRLIDYGGSDNEQSIRAAFQTCLAAYARAHRENLELVPELPTTRGVRPDGTVKDSMRLARGYWEAKDLHDNLDAEIQKKFASGYPDDNIVFENSRTAVLFQRGTVAMRVDMRQPAQLHRLLQSFLNFVTREVEDFRQAWQQFKKDLPDILAALRDAVRNAAESLDYRAAADSFLELCHRTIGLEVSEFDVQEMLIQHILTRDIFLRVFSEEQFHQENNIARQLDALAQTFFTGSLRRETVGELLPYYGAITAAAANIADYREKQHFLKAIYEDFYQTYNPAAADRLGVVYTPGEAVDFIIRGADYLLQKHFGRTLADDNVQILDPATGTGTFVTSLIDYLPADRLEYKYLNEIHANEVAILPYYIANLNIEYSYKERTGRYLEFSNLCFVDTLDNMGWQQSGATGDAVPRQPGLDLGAFSEENWLRLQEQNEKTISIIIGNPPYNDSATLWGDGSENRAYPEIDQRIHDTYVEESDAQKTHQYDMYKRFIRWASDRLADDGIIAFITNRAYLDALQDDGFRKVSLDEFSDLYVVDLGGNIRKNGRVGNIFGIMTGVAIGFFVRRTAHQGHGLLHYHALEDELSGKKKLAELKKLNVSEIPFQDIVFNKYGTWLSRFSNQFEQLMPLAVKQTKLAKNANDEQAVFGFCSNATKSNRDNWVYDFDARNLQDKTLFFVESYNEFLDNDDKSYNPVIKWSSTLQERFRRGDRIVYSETNLIRLPFRPFVAKYYFAEEAMNDRLTQNHYRMFGENLRQPNKVINVCVNGKDFYVLATDKLVDYHFTGDTQCLPLYRYTSGGQRVSNITDWGLRKFHEHYGDDSITAEDVFAYVYAVLHDPAYQSKYEVELLLEFPRLPLYQDFREWARLGRELLDLHIGFESAEPWPLERVEKSGTAGRPILRPDKDRNIIILDRKTTLTGIPVRAWWHELGNRSALEWVLDQYKERKPRDPTIAERFNTYRFADHKEQVIDLLRRVCTVSDKTVQITYWLDMMSESDPDEGLEFRPEFIAEMERQMASNEPTIPAEEVYRRLGLE